ncbi:Putative trehalase N2227-like protein [Scheffersomyces stipitis CBS 6054]|uniref:Putative trehalase N2227-like protein n=1 Tax=Scheffersomyces stipitis (strain ATCC 58785 / CBS 6054 / NBRC 10063 / NRRL Y-11545) TaxID=322104 RepID=A3LQ87_PICST|nr:Putative trehalase N2227-like protein [Scheffersomyces stipitis CBS 6054]ABN65164.2 Putative trehalase N2227-like protein [Scheffersomyces stipitis CBS 6054]
MISRSNVFQTLVQRLGPSFSKLITKFTNFPAMSSNSSTSANNTLKDSSKLELLTALRSLESYAINTKKTNDRRRKLFKLMTWRQQKLCEDVGYLQKLKRIDVSVQMNQFFLKAVSKHSFETFGLSFQDYHLLKDHDSPTQTSSSNYRVIESLGHFTRDWTAEGEVEIKPVWDYVRTQVDKLVKPQDRAKTCVVVPGSGLGRIAHELASYGSETERFGAVHAIEYSGLMHICNRFMYSSPENSSQSKNYEIYPYVHSCSNFYDSQSQFKSSHFSTMNQPKNLHLNHEDFRYFSLQNNYENIVVVSVFFMDTAENLVDYMDAIQSLTVPSKKNGVKNGYWINVGPLKYGSAAQVELNADEFALLRKGMGWKDVDNVKTVQEPNKYGENGLVGYITHRESMWQGYYGLNMYTSVRSENTCK